MSRYQVHCKTCLCVFERSTIEDSVIAVESHESEGKCVRPIYDAHGAYFVRGENI